MHKGLIIEFDRDTETCDILPGSAIVCRATADGGPLVGAHGLVDTWFEGNLHDAVNLHRFIEKIACAAGRMVTNYPTVARAAVLPGMIRVLADYDLRRNHVTKIVDEAGWRRMLDRPDVTYLAPPAPAVDMTDRAQIVAEMDKVGFRHISTPGSGTGWPLVFQLNDGRVLVHENSSDGTLFWPDDPRLEALRDHLAPEAWLRIEPELEELGVRLQS